jgi:hypothetical protein
MSYMNLATNVEEAFKAVIRRIRQLEDVIEMKPSHGNSVDLRKKSKAQQSGCCN